MTRRWQPVVAGLVALAAVAAQPAHAQLLNAGYESGVLGPWANSTDLCNPSPGCTNWTVSAGIGRGGSFGASNRGNILLRQNLASAVAANSITELSFWARHETGSVMAWFVAYSDGSTQEGGISTTNQYQKFNITGLNLTKNVVAVGAYGVSPPNNTAYLDDWTLTTTVPEPSSVILLASALLPLGYMVRRRRNS